MDMANKHSPEMHLSQLLQGVLPVASNQDCIVTGLCEDSRTLQPGDLFFARSGTKNNGYEFIKDAIAKGAVAIIAETNESEKTFELVKTKKIPLLFLTDLAQQIGEIAARFYGYPSRQLEVIGITGTNGKTSCAHFIAQALHMGNQPCGVIGTLGNGMYGQIHQGVLTTPCAITLQKLLADFRDQGAKYIAMETTSHSLVQGRVNGIDFDIAIYTNLSRDHLDYHGDMATYAKAKRLLFTKAGLRYAILNADDSYGQQWLQELKGNLSVFAYALGEHIGTKDLPSITAHCAQFTSDGITATIHTPWGDGVLHSPLLLGRFNLSNLLVVVAVLGIMGLSLEEILARIAKLRGVPGRMETYGGGKQPLVVVDFAHTPAALEQVLIALREHKTTEGRLWCIFGCGGDRDRGKRPLMGKIAEQYADQLIITDDNPRSEDSREIVAAILQGVTEPAKAVIEHDRRRAITHALSCARAGDVVLIAGKGHETYQIIGNRHEPFSDALEVQKLLM